MNVVQSYELWYDGAGMHDIRAAANAQLLGRLTNKAANQRVAEYFLRMLDYAGKNQKKIQQHKIVNHKTTNTRTLDYITHIHAKCKEDIESRWGEHLSDEEVNEILFEDTLLKELDKSIPKKIVIDVKV